jgi:hypothetical protein
MSPHGRDKGAAAVSTAIPEDDDSGGVDRSVGGIPRLHFDGARRFLNGRPSHRLFPVPDEFLARLCVRAVIDVHQRQPKSDGDACEWTEHKRPQDRVASRSDGYGLGLVDLGKSRGVHDCFRHHR